MYRFIVILFFSSFTFCSSTDRSRYLRESFPYKLDHPEKKFILPEHLSEISGITWFGNDTILCVQDEKAIVYLLSSATGKQIGKHIFGKDGDYEDLTCHGKTIYVLRSDGAVFMLENLDGDHKAGSVKTPLSERNNTEGLAWDDSSQSLLIACKGSPSTGKTKLNDRLKAVYQYDPVNDNFNLQPFLLMRLDKQEYFETPEIFAEFLKAGSEISFNPATFHPSGIAVHPEGKIYLLSATARILLILNRSGRIINFSFLDPDIFIQPEGICFSPGGDLYISNEGRGGYANILMFKPARH